MFQNNNYAVMKHISKASLKCNQTRNHLAGSVIALAAFLLTLIFTVGYNSAMEMKNWMDYQALFENVNTHALEKIKTNPDIEVYGKGERVGVDKHGNTSLLMLYADKNTMELSNVRMKTGSMPEQANQIVIEKGYLDAINSDAQIGDTITLSYRNDISRKMKTGSFVITGFLEAGTESSVDSESYNAIVSHAFIASDSALCSVNPSVVIKVVDAGRYSNEALKTKIKEIGKAVGVPEQSVSPNNMNIDSNNITPEVYTGVFAIAFVIIFACALAIYNIFFITIMRKVKEYGQLRTIGTTKRQIRKMVFREGKLISAKYIPLGILMGCGISYILRPSMWLPKPSVLLAFFAGCTTFLVVMFSLRKPAKIASCVSPLEALRYTGYDTDMGRQKRTVKKLTPFSLGKLYLTRTKKKTMITFLSLTMSGILFVAAASLMSSMNPAQRARTAFPYGGEYEISLNSDLLSPSTEYNDLQINNPLSTELKEKIAAIDGVDSVEVHKYIRGRLPGVDMYGGNIEIDNIRKDDATEYGKYLVKGSLPNFSAGKNQIVINCAASDYKSFGLRYRPGDKIVISIFDGKTQKNEKFTVSGIIENKNNGDTFLLPDQTMDMIMIRNCNLSFEILSAQGDSSKVESQLKALINSKEKLEFKSLRERTDYFRSAFHTMASVTYAFVALIACFSLVSLANTMITNVLSRKNEIGILQAVGLSRIQLKKMLHTENAYLIFGSFIISVIVGNILGYLFCKTLGNIGGFSYVKYQIPLLMMTVYILLIVILQAVTTKIMEFSIQRHSVVERLQEM